MIALEQAGIEREECKESALELYQISTWPCSFSVPIQRSRLNERPSNPPLQPGTQTHTGGVDDVVQAQFSDDGVKLEQQGQGLSDSTCDGTARRTERMVRS